MEFVYVVQRDKLFDLHFPHGLVSLADSREEVTRYLQRIREHGFFIERRKAEDDSSFKQIIPYVVVRSGDQILMLTRTNQQGETRLHGKRSIGVGGHINPVDGEQGDVVVMGLHREIEEELLVEGEISVKVAGVLNDDSTPVGSVHFGLIAVADITGVVSIRETDMMDGELVSVPALRARHDEDPDRFETWSSILVQRLDEVVAADLSLEQVMTAHT